VCPSSSQRRVTLNLPSLLDHQYSTSQMTLTSQRQVTRTQAQAWLALRVACGRCGSRQLERVQQNLVECSDCHTKQWSILNLEEGAQDSLSHVDSPGLMRSILVRLGFPQRAFVRYIPKATQFFWVRCLRCKKISADYAHGYSKYFICQFCQSEIRAL